MKETGIIMSGDHPVKYMDGTKTMTRRTYGLERINENPDDWQTPYPHPRLKDMWVFTSEGKGKVNIGRVIVKCPYGQVGDQLWVRETWAKVYQDWPPESEDSPYVIEYKADTGNVYPGYWPIEEKDDEACGRWKPSIFMPRWASRITLQITGLRAERLQEITEGDAEAEGVSWSPCGSGENPEIISAKENFAWLWDSLNAKRGFNWSSNPFVWVITFKRL